MTPSEPDWTIGGIRDAVLLARLRRWADEALVWGIGPSYQAAISEMRRGLTTDPLAWGDPLYNTPVLGTTTLHRGIFPIVVTYTVHPTARAVWVMNFQPYPDSGLSED